MKKLFAWVAALVAPTAYATALVALPQYGPRTKGEAFRVTYRVLTAAHHAA